MSISSQSLDTIRSLLDDQSSKKGQGIPGVAFTAVDRSGRTLVAEQAGTYGLNSSAPVKSDSLFWLASCTKAITAICAMQLVEQGKLDLDDPNSVYKVAPELKEKKHLKSDGTLGERQGEINLRNLLSHTAGFGYSFFNSKLVEWGRPRGIYEVSGDGTDLLVTPLVNQPGTVWEYGPNIDWTGVIVERVTGMRLNDYMHKYIFEPLQLRDITMFPTEEQQSRLVRMHQRYPDGSIEERDHLYRRPLWCLTPEAQSRSYHAGGHGLFGTPAAYVQILAALISEGKHSPTGYQLLRPDTVAEMFKNQIPDMPDFARRHLSPPPGKKDLTNPIPELYPQQGNPPQGWGLSFMLTLEEGATGRAVGTGHWAGLSNLFFWADPDKGVAGMIAAAVLPFGDMNVLQTWGGCEKAVYDGYQAASGGDL